MTLLTACKAAADEIGVPRPTTVIGGTGTTEQKLLRYANKAGDRIMRAYPWQQLVSERTFTSVASETQTSIIPSDLDRIVPETFWDRTNRILISGPVSAVQWQGLKAYGYNDTSRPKFRYRGDAILISPTPGAGNSYAFEYVSKNWCESSGGTAQSAFAADTDVTVINEELLIAAIVYEYSDAEGLPAESAYAAYLRLFNDLTRADNPTAGIMVAGDLWGGGRHFAGAPPVNGDSSAL